MDKKSSANLVKPPAGLQAIISECLKIYPDQPNPLQVTTVVKYWFVYQIYYIYDLFRRFYLTIKITLKVRRTRSFGLYFNVS